MEGWRPDASASLNNSLIDTASRSFCEERSPRASSTTALSVQHLLIVEYTKLDNGLTVATEIMPGQISTVSVFIKCGSRNETL